MFKQPRKDEIQQVGVAVRCVAFLILLLSLFGIGLFLTLALLGEVGLSDVPGLLLMLLAPVVLAHVSGRGVLPRFCGHFH